MFCYRVLGVFKIVLDVLFSKRLTHTNTNVCSRTLTNAVGIKLPKMKPGAVKSIYIMVYYIWQFLSLLSDNSTNLNSGILEINLICSCLSHELTLFIIRLSRKMLSENSLKTREANQLHFTLWKAPCLLFHILELTDAFNWCGDRMPSITQREHGQICFPHLQTWTLQKPCILLGPFSPNKKSEHEHECVLTYNFGALNEILIQAEMCFRKCLR